MKEETKRESSGAETTAEPSPAQMPRRALDWTVRVWRPAATAIAVALALMLGWHVINGKHGLSVWEQKRQEDKALQKEIEDLQQENARLKVRVERLKSDPDAIEHEARETLHYAKPGEVIVDLSGEKAPATAQAPAETK